MSDNEVLGGILRRWLTEDTYRYWSFNADRRTLTLDAKIELTDDEVAVIGRITTDR